MESDTPFSQTNSDGGSAWLSALRRYIGFVAVANLVWEIVQVPLYTIWAEEAFGKIAFAVIHCTGGDVLISGSALLGALMVGGDGRWPNARFRTVAAITVLAGLAYTIFSEWLNTGIRGSWAYTEWMPTLPFVGSGLAPVLQWLLIPPAAFWWAKLGTRPSRHPFPETGAA
jgi:hypothetical protein